MEGVVQMEQPNRIQKRTQLKKNIYILFMILSHVNASY